MKRVFDLTLSPQEASRFNDVGIVYEEPLLDDYYTPSQPVSNIQWKTKPLPPVPPQGQRRQSPRELPFSPRRHVIRVFTDGSCKGNGKANAIGGIGVHFPDKELPDVSAPYLGHIYLDLNYTFPLEHEADGSVGTNDPVYHGDKGEVTNQRAELCAIYTAVRYVYTIPDYVPKQSEVQIYTDSEYCINSLTNWVFNWEQNNWRTSAGKSVKNRDLLEPLFAQLQQNRIAFYHSKAHTNGQDDRSKGNAVADQLATKATQSQATSAPARKPKRRKVVKKIKPSE